MHSILGGWEGEEELGGGEHLFEFEWEEGVGWGWVLLQILNMLPTL